MESILSMRAEASEWLALRKQVNQWEKAWPTSEAQERRILEAIRKGRTWMFHAVRGHPCATVTLCDEDGAGFWRRTVDDEPAVYVHRLIVRREFHGRALGARILDWAAERGSRRGMKWMRIDIWRGNPGLEEYYVRQGFAKAGDIPQRVLDELGMPDYPSTVLMQRAVRCRSGPRVSAYGGCAGSR
ncbi:N-acetyltransferase [Planomonospora sp. ID82291]|uniref:GNAT family N-acetyltransferase n=1 Tax=Planomonospora sp. ID82291 TaxID=2738136 RepID=UPI0018C41391|nr:GNAT family N-acetyltransferase [Planomonospora sp. ID82291]MBG0814995.1 GNAT family N-acetyltransferase [Planomonospora sp. ID82291]